MWHAKTQSRKEEGDKSPDYENGWDIRIGIGDDPGV